MTKYEKKSKLIKEIFYSEEKIENNTLDIPKCAFDLEQDLDHPWKKPKFNFKAYL